MLNLSTLKTPGVYIDEVSVLPPAVAGVATSIPAFIGYTESSQARDQDDGAGGTIYVAQEPLRITNYREFQQAFGGPDPESEGLKLEIHEYQDADGNELRSEYPVPVMDESKRSKYNLAYSLQLYFANGGGPCYVVSVGAYQDGGTISKAHFEAGLAVLKLQDEPTLICIPEAINLASNADYIGIYQAALDQCNELQDRFAIINVKNEKGDALKDAEAFRNAPTLTNNRIYGAAYYPNLRTTIDYVFDDVDVVKKIRKTGEAETEEPVGKLSELNDPDHAAYNNGLYNVLVNVLSQVEMILPPGPAIAGVYVQTDTNRGVWKAPANVGVSAISGLTVKIDDKMQEELNVDSTAGKSINAIRSFTGRGTLVWGARTLEGNDNEWRYVNVRRFFNFVEESVKKASFRFVFEPNDANTWVSVRAMVENFLILQWRAGALQGAKPEQAFFVRVGLGQTMTEDDVLNGRLIIEVGMAVVRPAEFIVFRFMHKLPEA